MLKVRLVRGKPDKGNSYTGPLRRGGRILGQIEEYFLETLAPQDTFLFGGEILALRGIVENEALVSRADAEAPKIPSYDGGKFPLSTHSRRVCARWPADPKQWRELPEPVAEWLDLQALVRRCRQRIVCSSRPFRAAVAFISSPIRSKGGSHIRRSACC